MKTFVYDPGVYRRKITLTAGFCVFLILYAIYEIAGGFNPIWIAAIIIAGYFAWETFVSIANPSEVEISDEGIRFSAYGRSHAYAWKDVKKFHCKPIASGTKAFVRINKPTVFKGRYWVNCYYFENGQELFNYLFFKEAEIHPDGLRAASIEGSKHTKAKREDQAKRRLLKRRSRELAKQQRKMNQAKKR